MTFQSSAHKRDPSANPNPLDRASFYIEELKYGPGPGRVEPASREQLIEQLDTLLRDSKVDTMTGEELLDALLYYGESLSRNFHMPRALSLSMFLDGLMHGIAFAAGLKGEHRNPPGR